MPGLKVRSLHVYPLKGARAVDLDSAEIEPRGVRGDRRLLATDLEGRFLTQRDCAALARICARWRIGGVRLQSDDLADVFEAPLPAGRDRRGVIVWSDTVDALPFGPAADAWLSAALGRTSRLFCIAESADRRTSARFAPAAPIAFADAYPVLVTTAASLNALNAEIERNGGAAVGMDRFRPNIVIGGADPWAEDFWATITVGGLALDLVKPCDRCVVTTTDQRTGARRGKEPLASLARLRRSADDRINGVLFGWNAIPRGSGALKVGDAVRVVARRDEGWPLLPPA